MIDSANLRRISDCSKHHVKIGEFYRLLSYFMYAQQHEKSDILQPAFTPEQNMPVINPTQSPLWKQLHPIPQVGRPTQCLHTLPNNIQSAPGINLHAIAEHHVAAPPLPS